MPRLKNLRHEAAVGYRLAGLTQVDAYEQAGYKRNRRVASSLFQRPEVKTRLAELQDKVEERIIERRAVTKEMLTDEMDENRDLALEEKQAAAAQTATRDKAKMHGFMTDKQIRYTKSIDDMTEAELDALLGESGGDDD